MKNIVVENHSFFIYENKKQEKLFVIADASKNDFIEAFNITNYDFTEKEFKEFLKEEKITKELFNAYKKEYCIKTKLAAFLLCYCGF